MHYDGHGCGDADGYVDGYYECNCCDCDAYDDDVVHGDAYDDEGGRGNAWS